MSRRRPYGEAPREPGRIEAALDAFLASRAGELFAFAFGIVMWIHMLVAIARGLGF